MGQLVAGGKPGGTAAWREFKARHKHIARQHPEDIAQQRQRAGDAAGGFQRAAKVHALVRV
jgi:hypothetical protein